ncbi:MAG: single-stranded DNA-binding protein [Chitinophagaceae bacterium]|nr:MAG: single-stranded DNA-binding protein [Chitinophagaceae bacterium]
MIKMTAIGNLGKDCTTNTVNGRNVINFSIAHTEKYKDAQGNPVEKTTWVECAYWTDRTAVSQYLRKGTQVYVEGIPEARSYPKNDGTTGVSLTVRVQSVQLLGTRPDGGAPSQSSGGFQSAGSYNRDAAPVAQGVGESTDDLPF